MTAPDPDQFNLLKDAVVPFATMLIGGLGTYFFMNAKDRRDARHKRLEESRTLRKEHDAAADAYQKALTVYVQAPHATLENFYAISKSGDAYFSQLKIEAAAILSGLVDVNLRIDLIGSIERACRETLPDHYATLRTIAATKGYGFDLEPDRSDYEILYTVAEKWSSSHVDAHVRQ